MYSFDFISYSPDSTIRENIHICIQNVDIITSYNITFDWYVLDTRFVFVCASVDTRWILESCFYRSFYR